MREVVAVRGLMKRFGSVVALDDVTFTLEGPQLVFVLGPNGAGKTTLLDILLGLGRQDAGEVRLFGASARPYPRRRVGVVMQRESVLDEVTTGEYAELFASIHGVRGGRERILTEAALHERASVPLRRLSGGEAARLFVAASSVHDPDLLLLDEPTAHLDPENKLRIGQLLKAKSAERTVVVTTHDLREADALADHLLFLVGGRVRAEGPRDVLVEAVPAGARSGLGVEDAFFHFCSIRIRDGEAID
jgi:ABC-2 type transport system ATP-binding protein